MTAGDRVFDDRNRSNASPASHTESSAAFLNRVAGSYWDQIRGLVEDWVTRVTDVARRDIVARLRSPDNRQSTAAFWELYLHETFVRAGYSVEPHPVVAGPRPPDFRLKRDEDCFYVEATCIFGAATDAGATARQQALFDAVSRMHSPNFFLAIDVDLIGPLAPPTRRLRRDLERWLAHLNPDTTELQLGRDSTGDHFLWDEHAGEFGFVRFPFAPTDVVTPITEC